MYRTLRLFQMATSILTVTLLLSCNSNSKSSPSNDSANTTGSKTDSMTTIEKNIKPLGYCYFPAEDTIKAIFSPEEAPPVTLVTMKGKQQKDSTVIYVPFVLPDGTASTFCLGEARETALGTHDPQFSWATANGWKWDDNMQYKTAYQGVWETKCHATMTHGRDGNAFRLWFSNGTPGEAKHEPDKSDMPIIIDIQNRKWHVCCPSYESGEYSKVVINRVD